ncbi:MAG: hypothetical protein PVG14_00235 [Anaerolineales bacterium]|jgi:hypothetical protein
MTHPFSFADGSPDAFGSFPSRLIREILSLLDFERIFKSVDRQANSKWLYLLAEGGQVASYGIIFSPFDYLLCCVLMRWVWLYGLSP